jgi:hypothetical protein
MSWMWKAFQEVSTALGRNSIFKAHWNPAAPPAHDYPRGAQLTASAGELKLPHQQRLQPPAPVHLLRGQPFPLSSRGSYRNRAIRNGSNTRRFPGTIRTRRSSWPAGYHSASMSCSWGLIPEQKKTSKLRGTSRRRRRSSGNPGMCRALVRAHHKLHGTLGAANPRFIQREVFANGSVKTSAE